MGGAIILPMDHDPAILHAALAARDARFDGRFFVGVTSTGIFCRPVCPARTPKPDNCRFFPSAAAALAAGFRPCLRCRPETAPWSPAWSGAGATVARALRLIEHGALDDGSVETLAAHLGVGGRHLRRLFDTHLGASPKAVAKARRVLLARQLIRETALPMTEIALASGYGSLRRFNAEMAEACGCAPSTLRRSPDADGGGLDLLLPYRPPYDWPSLAGFLARRAIPGVEVVDLTAYRRLLRVGEAVAEIVVTPEPEKNSLRIGLRLSALEALPAVLARVRRVFDLEADPAAIASALGGDALLARLLTARPGLRLVGGWDGFELAVRAVLGQQVSVAAARTFAWRLVEACGAAAPEGASPGLQRLFPTPQAVAAADLSGLGLTGRRQQTLRALAEAFAAGRVPMGLDAAPPALEAALTAVPGIGAWTAQYVCMRALGAPDAFPHGDLGLIRAVERLGGGRLTPKALETLAEGWRPWRAYAALHLWAEDAA